MVKVHSSVGLITNSSTVIFSAGAFERTAEKIESALRELLLVVDSKLKVEDVLDVPKLRKAIIEDGLTEDEVGGSYEDNEIYYLIDIMSSWSDYRRNE